VAGRLANERGAANQKAAAEARKAGKLSDPAKERKQAAKDAKVNESKVRTAQADVLVTGGGEC